MHLVLTYFNLFQEGDGTPKVDLNSSKSSRKSAVKKASSTPAINEIDKKSKNILVSVSMTFKDNI